jgi:hypothetical protein
MRVFNIRVPAALGFLLFPLFALAQDAPPTPVIANSGDTAWLITATALVLFMTLPGLALFYAGLVRAKNVLSILIQCFAITCVVSLLWLAVGYSLAFSDGGGAQDFIGGLDKAFLAGVGRDAVSGSIPESVFFMFQMTFAIITPALVIGGFAERMRFGVVLGFSALWLLVVYCAHRALGMGRRLARQTRRHGLCGRHRGARERGRGGTGFAHWCWARAADSRTPRWPRTACRSPWQAPACCGWAGSASTQAVRLPRTGPRAWPCSRRTWVRRAARSPG